MKKIISVFLILIVVIMLLIFQAPDIASRIEKIVWMEGLTSKIHSLKGTVDTVSTNIPTKDDLVDTYNKLSSGAVEWTQKVIDTANTAKAKVDQVRETLSGAQDTLDKTIKVVNDVQKTVEEGKQVLDEVNQLWADLKTSVTTSWSSTK